MSDLKSIETWALSAYVDGELEPVEHDAVDRLLAENPDARATIEAYRKQNEALKAAFAGVVEEPIPAQLKAALAHGRRWNMKPLLNLAAGLALLMIGGAGGWFMANAPHGLQAEAVADAAISAQEVYAPEVRHPVEVFANDSDHLQKWLSKRVGVNFAIPDLTAEGFTLVGGRLLAVADQPAAQIMYEDAGKQRITVLLTANPGHAETDLKWSQKGDITSCFRLGRNLAFAMAGVMDKGPMKRLAGIIYDGFES